MMAAPPSAGSSRNLIEADLRLRLAAGAAWAPHCFWGSWGQAGALPAAGPNIAVILFLAAISRA